MAWNAPATVAAKGKLLATFWNAQVRDNFKAIGDPWTAYTCTTTNLTLGTPGQAIVSSFMQAGKLVHYYIDIVLGTGGTLSGNLSLSLPVLPLKTTTNFPMGICSLQDASASATVHGWARWNPGTTAISLAYNNATPTNSTGVGSAAPWTWAVSDRISVQGTYEAA